MKNIIQNITNDKEITKNLKALNYYEAKDLIRDAKIYIKAIKSGAMCCIIHSVSNSGMSRVISFHSCEKTKTRYNYRQYNCLFIALGYKEDKNRKGFKISGCGMDMVFHTNYSIIRSLKKIGLINDTDCRTLEQQTPTVLS